jgi:hypothetical protein
MVDAAQMGPGWARAWSSAAHPGDSVYHHKETNQVRFFGEKPCGHHDLGTFCAGCLVRVDALLRAANHVLTGKKPPA